jgi:hypothetical protein
MLRQGADVFCEAAFFNADIYSKTYNDPYPAIRCAETLFPFVQSKD